MCWESDGSLRHVSLSRQGKRNHSATPSSSKSDSQIQPNHALDLLPLNRESDQGLQLQNAPFQDLRKSVTSTQASSPWLPHLFPPDPMEMVPLPTSMADFNSKGIGFQENIFNSSIPHRDSDNSSLLSVSRHSPSSTYPIPESDMSSISYGLPWSSAYVTSAYGTPERSSHEQSRHQSTEDDTTWPMQLTEASEAALPPGISKTVLTMENLDVDTRRELLELLCRRKIVTRIEIV